jgi:2-amino-4-hydroxy-6-hydroxymethyldihydropteridine diphosphokinase
MGKSLHTVYLLLGGNLNNIEQTFINAISELKLNGCEIEQTSSLYESPPWGFESSNTFLNQVLSISTSLLPKELLDTIQSIEQKLGRVRTGNNASYESRTIDIDILYFNSIHMKSPHLTIPHPEIQNRRFTLLPLTEINPSFFHPILNKSNSELLDLCSDNSLVTKK